MEKFGEEPIREPKGLKELRESSLKINVKDEKNIDSSHSKEQEKAAQDLINDLNIQSSRSNIEEKNKSFFELLKERLISEPSEKEESRKDEKEEVKEDDYELGG